MAFGIGVPAGRLPGGFEVPSGLAPADLGKRVKIYVAAGPLGDRVLEVMPGVFVHAEGPPCEHKTASSCRIYEIDWPVPDHAVDLSGYVRVVVRQEGASKPTVDRTGRYLMCNYREERGARERRIRVTDLTAARPLDWYVDGAPVADLAGFNSAWDPLSSRIWFNRELAETRRSGGGGGGPGKGKEADDGAVDRVGYDELWYVDVQVLGDLGAVVHLGEHQPLERKISGLREWVDLAWPALNPSDPSKIAVNSSWMVPANMASYEEIDMPWVEAAGVPAPTDHFQSPAVGAVVDWEQAQAAGSWYGRDDAGPQNYWTLAFDSPSRMAGGWPGDSSELDLVGGLAHFDWSPDGRRLISFEQEGETLAAGRGQARVWEWLWGLDELQASRYDIVLSGGDLSVSKAPMFRHAAVEDLPLDAAAATGSVTPMYSYLHKYAVFCGKPGDEDEDSGSWVLAMVAGQQEDRGSPYRLNRVYLIDVHDRDNPVYHDLTALVERFEEGSVTFGMGSILAASGPWYRSASTLPLPVDEVVAQYAARGAGRLDHELAPGFAPV